MTSVDAFAAALFILGAFTLAGVAQIAWFATPRSRAFAVPLDGGLRFRGRRVFGANKTLRGVVVMVPAAAVAFALLAWAVPDVEGQWIWPIPIPAYAALGAWAALGFMAGELPNSFLKRQLDIAPGEAADGSLAFFCHLLLDRIDSGLGLLIAMSLVVEVPAPTWAYVLLLGPFIHWSFSAVMFRFGLKGRPA